MSSHLDTFNQFSIAKKQNILSKFCEHALLSPAEHRTLAKDNPQLASFRSHFKKLMNEEAQPNAEVTILQRRMLGKIFAQFGDEAGATPANATVRNGVCNALADNAAAWAAGLAVMKWAFDHPDEWVAAPPVPVVTPGGGGTPVPPEMQIQQLKAENAALRAQLAETTDELEETRVEWRELGVKLRAIHKMCS